MTGLSLLVIGPYLLLLLALSLYGLHRYWILYLYWRHYKSAPPLAEPPSPAEWPRVTVQLPIYNERYVVARLIETVCRLEYPKDRLQVQVLDDSTDDTSGLAARLAAEKRAQGFDVRHVRRASRAGFKAGALAEGLRRADGEFLAIFDADFLPPPDFLRRTVPHFADPRVGMVQARWDHINLHYSLLTRLQSIYIDGHFMLEHTARNRSGAFFNFNGTAGVWRREALLDAGDWSDDTLTEDLDVSYRAQLKGWKFLFLPEVVCPAELPVDMAAFRSQQHRWAKGALQVARKILPSLWRSRLPLAVKCESTAHLTANASYLLVLALSLLWLPSLILRRFFPWPEWVGRAELAAFLPTTLSIALFYVAAQRESRARGYPLCLRDVPALMGFGIGMCVNNSRAVWEALAGVRTEFRRTPKFGLQGRGGSWRDKTYRAAGGSRGWAEILLGSYFVAVFAWTVSSAHWASLPFIALFLFGYGYVGLLTLSHRLQKA